MIDELRQDLRYGVRSLLRSPGFTAAALLTLALGIGANTAIFSVVRAVLLAGLPFPQAIGLFASTTRTRRAGSSEGQCPRRISSTGDAPASSPRAWAPSLCRRADGRRFDRRGQPRAAVGHAGHGRILPDARNRPLLGRTLAAEDHVAGRDRVVVISHGLWTRRFGADPSIVGRPVTLNQTPSRLSA